MNSLAEPPVDPGDAALPGNRVISGFCASDYRVLLENLVAAGYAAVPLHGLVPDRRVMFLRHDVDLCLSYAVRVAQVEAALGLKSTFYILVSSDIYNPMVPTARRGLRALVEMGHSIGLHFDPLKYQDGGELEGHARAECDLLERIANAPVESISFHRPSPDLLGLEGTFAGRRHTYEPCFFRDVAYVSDSSGGWYRGHPLDHAAVKRGHAIQLLTHPIWWHADSSISSEAAIEVLRGQRHAAVETVLALATAKASSLKARLAPDSSC